MGALGSRNVLSQFPSPLLAPGTVLSEPGLLNAKHRGSPLYRDHRLRNLSAH